MITRETVKEVLSATGQEASPVIGVVKVPPRQHGLPWYAVRDRAGGRMLGNCGLFAGRTGSAEPGIGYEIRCSCQG